MICRYLKIIIIHMKIYPKETVFKTNICPKIFLGKCIIYNVGEVSRSSKIYYPMIKTTFKPVLHQKMF